MQFGQWWRRFLRGLRGRRAGDEGPVVERMDAAPFSNEPSVGEAAGGAVRWIIIIVVVLALLYYPVGSMLDHEVRDDPDWAPAAAPDGASQAVAVASGLITREVDQVGWVANTPPLAPNALLKYGGNMMNFQVGITTAIGLFTVEMRDRLGRARGSSDADADLTNAASKIQWEADNWVFRWGSLLPQAAAEDEYRQARDALTTYNTRLARGDAVFDARADNLLAVLDRFALDIGSLSAQTEQRIASGRRSFPLDRRADKHYYKVKGHAYAYAQFAGGPASRLRRRYRQPRGRRRAI